MQKDVTRLECLKLAAAMSAASTQDIIERAKQYEAYVNASSSKVPRKDKDLTQDDRKQATTQK